MNIDVVPWWLCSLFVVCFVINYEERYVKIRKCLNNLEEMMQPSACTVDVCASDYPMTSVSWPHGIESDCHLSVLSC